MGTPASQAESIINWLAASAERWLLSSMVFSFPDCGIVVAE
jgi:hypothetical protein